MTITNPTLIAVFLGMGEGLTLVLIGGLLLAATHAVTRLLIHRIGRTINPNPVTVASLTTNGSVLPKVNSHSHAIVK